MTFAPTTIRTALAASCILLSATPAFAQDELTLQELKDQIDEQERRLEELEAREQGPEIKLGPGLSVKDAKNGNSFALDGRITGDVGFASSDDGFDYGDAADFRFVWLGVKGTIADDWGYRIIVDFSNGTGTLKDAFLTYKGFKNAELRVGQFREYNGLENQSGNLHLMFIERSSATTTPRPLRALGVGGQIGFGRVTAQAALSRQSASDTSADDEGWDATGRLYAAPIYNKDKRRVVHIGGGVRYTVPAQANQTARFRSRGESHVIDARLIDTGTIANVDSITTVASEAYVAAGPFSVAAEYTTNSVETMTGDTREFDGGYVAVSWFLTGEQRSFSMRKGAYGRVKPFRPLGAGGAGAFEVAARMTVVDLTDGPVQGGTLHAYTAGLNWHPNDRVKIMLNEVLNITDGEALVPDAEAYYTMLRFQIDF